MNLNKKGYTLIELLAVILIIGLILVLSTYGIIKAVKSSKEKVTTLSEIVLSKPTNRYSKRIFNASRNGRIFAYY